MTSLKENFGESIRKRRIELGFTQQRLARKVGVSQNFIAYLETNQRHPSTEMIQKLAPILRLPSDRLYFLANSDKLKGIVDFGEEKLKRKISPVLTALKNDQAMRRQHRITDEEIEMLASIRGRGEIRKREDYLFLLMSLRQVLR